MTTIVKDSIASSVGTAMCVYTGQPLDTVKVRMQARPNDFVSPWQCLTKTARGEGTAALWKGSTPALSGAIFENIGAFCINRELKRRYPTINQPGEYQSLSQPFALGAITGLCSSFLACPPDVIKCRTQITHGSRSSALLVCRELLKSKGPAGLFTGIGAQAVRDTIFYTFFFGVYDIGVAYMKRIIPPEKQTRTTDYLTYIMAGGTAGVFGWSTSMPFDVAKSIIQTAETPKSLGATLKQVYGAKGWRGLYVGVEAACYRAFPSNAALFLGYEICRQQLDFL